MAIQCLVSLTYLGLADPPPARVTLAWDASAGANIAGYRIYQGVASGVYTNIVDVGDTTSATISNLVAGVTYYFAATAYDLVGLESPFSAEIQHTPPSPQPNLRLVMGPQNQPLLSVTGPAGQSYNLVTSTDLRTWSRLGSLTLDTNGFTQFVDADGVQAQGRFYRLEQTSP